MKQTKAQLTQEMEDTKEALRRSRAFSQLLINTLNSNRIVPLEESAERLCKAVSPEFHSRFFKISRDEWMAKFISLIS